MKTLQPTDPNYPRYVQLNAELATLRKAMRRLKKERAHLLGEEVPGDRPRAAAPGVPDVATVVAMAAQAVEQPAGFTTAPASAPRRRSTDQHATGRIAHPPVTTATVAEKVREVFVKHPGTVYTPGTMATAIGLGGNLRGPVGDAIKALVKTKEVTEVKRGKFAHLAEAPAAAPPAGA